VLVRTVIYESKIAPIYSQVFCTGRDVGGCDKIRPLLRHYFSGVDAVVWIVDSSDGKRLAESVDELQIIVAGLDEKQEEVHPGVPKHPVLMYVLTYTTVPETPTALIVWPTSEICRTFWA
jgi:hypothetical protein